ncbi:MAG TPA: VPA1262 family N-terminal domain-containing protein, partial [Polyangium sp.]|nr:VPA1262 family N-terminal domain-containing protein [Polyangium sp.]
QTQNKAYWSLRSTSLQMDAMQTVRVKAPGGTYEVSRSGGMRIGMEWGGKSPLPSANMRLTTAHEARKKRHLAAQQGQQWFRGDSDHKEQARDLLRGLLHAADTCVRIVDPYFGADELADFALAVGQSEITIEILTSGEGLTEWKDTQKTIEKGTALRNALRRIQDQTSTYVFDIRVMPGHRPKIHDRFFLIDDRIWLLGSSLNEFGSRGTMMLALPNPDAIRNDLDEAWNASLPLENWLQNREENQRKAAEQKENNTP